MMAALKSRSTFGLHRTTPQHFMPSSLFEATFLSTLPTAHPLSIIDWSDFATAETFDDFPWEEENEASCCCCSCSVAVGCAII